MSLDGDVEVERSISWRAHLDVVPAGGEIEMLKTSVEVVDDSGVIPVDVHFRIRGLDLEPQLAGGTLRVERIRRVSVRRISRRPRGKAVAVRTHESVARPEGIVVRPEAPQPERATEVRPHTKRGIHEQWRRRRRR